MARQTLKPVAEGPSSLRTFFNPLRNENPNNDESFSADTQPPPIDAAQAMPSSLSSIDSDNRDIPIGDNGIVYAYDAGATYIARIIPELCAICAEHALHLDAAVVWYLAKLILDCVSLRFLVRKTVVVEGDGSSKKKYGDQKTGTTAERWAWRLAREDELSEQLLVHIHEYRDRIEQSKHGTRGSSTKRNPPLPDADQARGLYMSFDVLFEAAPPDPKTSLARASHSVVPLRLAQIDDPHHYGNQRFLEIVKSCAASYHTPNKGYDEMDQDDYQDVVMWGIMTKVRNGTSDVRFLVFNPQPSASSMHRWRVATEFEELLTVAKYLEDAREGPNASLPNNAAFPAAYSNFGNESSGFGSPGPVEQKIGSNYAKPSIPTHQLTVLGQRNTKMKQLKAPKPSRSSALQRSKEPAGPSNERYITSITPYDVIFGRGKPLARFSGNVRMRDIVEIKKKVYADAHKSIKSRIIKETMDEIMASPDPNIPVRFLKPVRDGVYELAHKQDAHSKISHRLREAPSNKTRNRKNAEKQQQQHPSSASASSSVKSESQPNLPAADLKPSPKKNEKQRKHTTTAAALASAIKSPGKKSGGSSNDEAVTASAPDDIHVVFGKESFLKKRRGNVHFRGIIADHSISFRDAKNQSEKDAVVSAVFNLVKQGDKVNAYHLMKLGNQLTWVKATDESLREKIAEELNTSLYGGLDSDEEEAGETKVKADEEDDENTEDEAPAGGLSALASISSKLYRRNTTGTSNTRAQVEPEGFSAAHQVKPVTAIATVAAAASSRRAAGRHRGHPGQLAVYAKNENGKRDREDLPDP